MIFHIPHSSKTIPRDLRTSLLLDDASLSAELILMTDAHTDDLFGAHARGEDVVVRFQVSRLIVDPERFTDDSREEMAEKGMGVIYERTSSQSRLRAPVSKEMKEGLIKRYYKTHHKLLTEAVGKELGKRGQALIVDCHSFPKCPLPYEKDKSLPRPDICLGKDDYHTPRRIVKAAKDGARTLGLSWEINRPFAGTLVPEHYYRKDQRVASIMVELNRSLYMDEATGEKLPMYDELKRKVGLLLDAIRTAFELKS